MNMRNLLLTCALVASASVAAQTFDVDGIRYKVMPDNPAAVSVESKTPLYSGDIVIPTSVTNDGETYSVVALTQSASATTTDGAFANCNSLQSVTLPETLQSIGNYSFNGCSSLTSLEIPQSVNNFGQGAFQNCTSLASISMPENALSVGANLFSGCAALTSLSIPEGIQELPNRVLYGLNSLTSISLPSTLTAIGNDNFRNCKLIPQITIPEGVTSVGEYFASQCEALNKVELPSTLLSIGKYSFWNSKVVTYISCAAATPPMATNAFYSWTTLYPNCTLYVPEASIPAYRAADVWSNFTNVEALLPPPAAIGTEFTAAGISYVVKENTDRLTVAVTMSDDSEEGTGYSGAVNIPQTVTYEGREYIVTEISVGAFYSCKQLTSVALPSTVETMGDFAFAHCENLTSISALPASLSSIGPKAFIYTDLSSLTVAEGNTAFAADQDVLYGLDENGAKTRLIVCAPGSTGNKNVPEGVTDIEYGAFARCEQVSGISLPASLVSIGDYAFDGCLRLYQLAVPDNVTHIGAQAFYKCTYLSDLTLPSNLETIEEGTFMFCSALTSLPLPQSVTSIGKYAFEACTGLTEIAIPESCVFIGDHAFEECRNITSVSFPAGLVTIDDFAFLACSGIETLQLPVSMDLIGYGAFKDCGSIASISMPAELGELRGYAFGNCANLTSIVIPDGITIIADRLFWGCTKLSDIRIPTSVTEIGPFAFDRTPITEIILHEGVTTIGEDAFQHCKQLEVISLPTTVTYIDKYAFWDCVSAREFTSLAIEPPFAEKAFSSGFPSATCVLYVPSASLDLYSQADGWKRFDNIKALPAVGDTFTCDGISYRVTVISEEGNSVEVMKSDALYTGAIEIPESVTDYYEYSVTAIADEAFADCAGLTTITLPATIESIGEGAFRNCTGLQKIICLGVNPASVSEGAFEGVDTEAVELEVPEDALEAYKTAEGWKEFFRESGISSITEESCGAREIHDLTGRKIDSTTPLEPGIYIVNGRKVVVTL